MSELKQIIDDSFVQYAGAVLQSRALVDVRDCLKPSARQILYCMNMCKYTADKPFQASAAVVGDAMKYFYIHGDASCLGVVMRAGQPFAMRYPLVDVGGNGGNLMASGNWAAARYTKARLSKLSSVLFNDIDKDTIDDWRDNFSDTEQYPAVLPSKGFYNLVNGSTGIGIGMASSLPQYNIRELNNALITLLNNPDCTFEDIYCAPDFATGAILYNESEVKESMKTGNGAACKLRSVIDFDNKERCFIVTEIPYSVYTNTICEQLETICNGEENPGIERFNDLTGSKPLIKIYISKKAQPEQVLQYLYKNTSLQYYYGINFTMLDQGKFPKVFTWKEMLQAHIDHEKIVYRRGFEFDLNKINNRLHIIDGLLICLANIDEVVQVIKNSNSTAQAAEALKNRFVLDDAQVKAILDMKLSRLAHLEVKKLEDEKTKLETEKSRIEAILASESLLNAELIKGWEDIIKIYGDERRTKILDLTSNGDTPVEIEQLQISLTNHNNIFVLKTSSLCSQKRGGVGLKLKLDAGESILNTVTVNTNETLMFFTNKGETFNVPAAQLPLETKTSLYTLAKGDFNTVAMSPINTNKQFVLFLTTNGIVKKSPLTDYKTNRKTLVKAINLAAGDSIVSVAFVNDTDKFGILAGQGNFIIINVSDVRATGRISAGVGGIKLNEDDCVVAGHIVNMNTDYIISITDNGLCKQTSMNEFSIQTRNTKGSRIQKLNDGDAMADFTAAPANADVSICSSKACLKIASKDIPILERSTLGNRAIKLSEGSHVTSISLL